MVSQARGGKKDAAGNDAEVDDEYKEAYKDLLKVVEKEARTVRV